jgi:MYXO-CTERM domain-containing protein
MRPTILFLALAALTPPAHALAQSNSTGEIDIDNGRNDNGSSKLGLLGLLGLAGLFGLKRREPDIHVDARRDRSDEGADRRG